MSAVVDTAPVPEAPALSALAWGSASRAIAFDGGGPVSLETFLREVRGVAATLPDARHVINLCDDRYRFLVAFCAAALRGQVTLLPPSRETAVVGAVLAQHPQCYCLGDRELSPAPPQYLRLPTALPQRDGADPVIQKDALVAIGFTSGSTGQSRPNPKTWASFMTSTGQNLAALTDLLAARGSTPVVATVPPQHMYGMEMSVLLPLLGNVAVHAGRPFFPHDVAQALAEASTAALLVTTPLHLRALVGSNLPLPTMAGIVSATAPLPVELARAAEDRFGCEVRELFGSTETCIFARRRSARETAWTLLPGVSLAPQPGGTAVKAPHLAQPVVLDDIVELVGDGRFELRGRNADLLEIAGKRASLGDLTRKLLAVPGVVDGVVLQLDGGDSSGVRRIAALVVAPELDETAVLAALRGQFDPVFLPRRIRCVAALPRNECGKVRRDALLALLHG